VEQNKCVNQKHRAERIEYSFEILVIDYWSSFEICNLAFVI